jgi:hypothetical protein
MPATPAGDFNKVFALKRIRRASEDFRHAEEDLRCVSVL